MEVPVKGYFKWQGHFFIHSLTHLKPKAIYIGVKTAKEQAEKIYMICKQQNIPCYKMLQSYVTSDFSLDHIPYEEFAATHYTQNK